MWETIKNYIKTNFTHQNLREIAKTLQHFCLIEIAIIAYACYWMQRLLEFYMSIVTPENFNEVAFWGAVSGIVVSIIGSVKYMSDKKGK